MSMFYFTNDERKELTGFILSELRTRHYKSQDDISKELGIPRPSYSRYENGKSDLPIEALVRLAHYYKVSTDIITAADVLKVSDDFEIVADHLQQYDGEIHYTNKSLSEVMSFYNSEIPEIQEEYAADKAKYEQKLLELEVIAKLQRHLLDKAGYEQPRILPNGKYRVMIAPNTYQDYTITPTENT